MEELSGDKAGEVKQKVILTDFIICFQKSDLTDIAVAIKLEDLEGVEEVSDDKTDEV